MAEAKRINGKIISIGLVTDDLNLLKDRLVNRRKTEKRPKSGIVSGRQNRKWM